MKIHLKSVEFWRDLRGPGPRNQSDITATFTTMKIKPGDSTPTPTGLVIVWDQEAHAVYVMSPKASVDPVVILEWSNVRRAISETWDWIDEGKHRRAPAAAEEPPKAPAGPQGRVLA